MKNKALTYGLFIVVGIVWYQVFMRVKSNFGEEASLPVRNEALVFSRKISKPDNFKLLANYRDPFTGKLASAELAPVNPDPNTILPQTNLPKPKPEPIVIQWPTIKYYGLVRKTTSNDPRTLIAIDGSMYKIKQGEQVLDNIFIQKVTRDFVQVRYKKEVRTFQKVVK